MSITVLRPNIAEFAARVLRCFEEVKSGDLDAYLAQELSDVTFQSGRIYQQNAHAVEELGDAKRHAELAFSSALEQSDEMMMLRAAQNLSELMERWDFLVKDVQRLKDIELRLKNTLDLLPPEMYAIVWGQYRERLHFDRR